MRFQRVSTKRSSDNRFRRARKESLIPDRTIKRSVRIRQFKACSKWLNFQVARDGINRRRQPFQGCSINHLHEAVLKTKDLGATSLDAIWDATIVSNRVWTPSGLHASLFALGIGCSRARM